MQRFLAFLDFAPWQCWRQGHRWLPCLREPVHRYEVPRFAHTLDDGTAEYRESQNREGRGKS